LWIADCGLKIEVLKPQSEIPLTKVSVFPAAASLQTGFPLRSNTFQLLCFFFLTPESLTPETSNSEICHHKSPPFFGTICADLIGNSHDEISGLERTIGCDSVVSIRNY